MEHNYQLFAQLPRFIDSPHSVLVGVSRKSMLGAVTEKTTEHRLAASVAAATMAASFGAKIIRVHDVDETVDAVKFVNAVNRQK